MFNTKKVSALCLLFPNTLEINVIKRNNEAVQLKYKRHHRFPEELSSFSEGKEGISSFGKSLK